MQSFLIINYIFCAFAVYQRVACPTFIRPAESLMPFTYCYTYSFFRFSFCSCSCVVRAPVGTLAVALPLRPLSLCLCLAHSVACPSIRLMNLLAHVGSVVIWSSFVAFVLFGAELEIKQKRETEIKSVLYLLQPFCGGCYPTNCH